MNLENVNRDDWIVAGLALLLIVDLLFLPWFSISANAGPISLSVSFTATEAPDGWLGVLAVLAALALIADLAIERLAPQTQLPAIQGSRGTTRLVLAALAAGFVALKFLFHIHFSLFGFGFYAAVVLAAALVYVSLQARRGAPFMQAGRTGPAGPPAV
jgi:hypothetical protein